MIHEYAVRSGQPMRRIISGAPSDRQSSEKSMTPAKEKLHSVQEKACTQLHPVQCEGMNSRLLIGNTTKSRKQLARDAARQLSSARINLAQCERFASSLRPETLETARRYVVQMECDVAFWKSEGELS